MIEPERLRVIASMSLSGSVHGSVVRELLEEIRRYAEVDEQIANLLGQTKCKNVIEVGEKFKALQEECDEKFW